MMNMVETFNDFTEDSNFQLNSKKCEIFKIGMMSKWNLELMIQKLKKITCKTSMMRERLLYVLAHFQ
jgi:hypothetical protein